MSAKRVAGEAGIQMAMGGNNVWAHGPAPHLEARHKGEWELGSLPVVSNDGRNLRLLVGGSGEAGRWVQAEGFGCRARHPQH